MDSKALLLARLAAERSDLLWEFTRLDASTLTTECICGDWTAIDVLAHVAAWDEINSDRVRAILKKRSREVTLIDTDSTNAGVFADRHEWTLPQAVEACTAARAEFRSLIAPLSWDEIVRPHPFAGRAEYAIRDLTERRAFHDALHSTDLRAWRKYADPPAQAGPGVMLRAALDAGRAELIAWTALVPEDQRSTLAVCGDWNVQDVLGHIADWEQFALEVLDDMAAGQVGGERYDGDEEAWNWQHVQARRGQPWEITWSDFNTTRQGLLDRLLAMEDAELARPARCKWPEKERPYAWFLTGIEHDREHAEGIRAALPG